MKKHFMGARVYDNKGKQTESQKNCGSGGAWGGNFFGYSVCFHNGYIALMTVLIAGLIATSITISLLQLGTSETKTGITREESNRAKAIANSCAEEALQQIRTSSSFAGNGTLTSESDTCDYTVVNLGGENREVTAIGNAGMTVHKTEIMIVDITPLIIVSSWQEVADF